MDKGVPKSLKSKARSRKFRLLNYMSDALVESYGPTLEEGFRNAAEAMTAVMVDLRTVSPKRVARDVMVSGFDRENLLYNWLEAVLVRKDTEREIYRSSSVKIQRTDGGFTLRGTLYGERIDPSRHSFKRDVKAITYHEMSVRKKRGSYVMRFLLDL
jgi:SHS2 domain-containing protein